MCRTLGIRRSEGRFGRLALSTILVLLITGCTAIPTPARIALLAPFEGRYREVGYEALYAARLALLDTDSHFIELLPVDDGGSAASAILRARALRTDPAVSAAIVLGPAATASAALAAFGDVAVLVVGNWGAQPAAQTVYILSNPDIRPRLTVPEHTEITDAARLPAPMTGDERLSLEQFGLLRPSLDGITILSSAALPDAAFAERYLSSDPFAPQPRLLASLSYDAVHFAALAVQHTASERSAVNQYLRENSYAGLNGSIRFEDGYWADAPVHEFIYSENGTLLPVDHVIE